MKVDAIEQRTSDATLISTHLEIGARATVLFIAVIPAWAGIGRGDEHERSRQRHRAVGPGDRHLTRFHRLAERLKRARFELRKLVEEQHARRPTVQVPFGKTIVPPAVDIIILPGVPRNKRVLPIHSRFYFSFDALKYASYTTLG